MSRGFRYTAALLIAAIVGLVLVGLHTRARAARVARAPVSEAPAEEPVPPSSPEPAPASTIDAAQVVAELRTGIPVMSIPIVMYHGIADRIPGGLDPLGTSLFEQQIAALARAHVLTMTIDDMVGVRPRSRFAHGAIALTFDDGLEDQYRVAFRILRRYGMCATFFVPTARVGTAGHVTWDQLREMVASGLVEVEPHTVRHRDLTAMPLADATREILDSQRAIRAQLGVPADDFAYPFGLYDPALEALLARAGFDVALADQPTGLLRWATRMSWGRYDERQSPAWLVSMALAARAY